MTFPDWKCMRPVLERDVVISHVPTDWDAVRVRIPRTSLVLASTSFVGCGEVGIPLGDATPEEHANLMSACGNVTCKSRLVIMSDCTPVREELARLKRRVAELEKLLG